MYGELVSYVRASSLASYRVDLADEYYILQHRVAVIIETSVLNHFFIHVFDTLNSEPIRAPRTQAHDSFTHSVLKKDLLPVALDISTAFSSCNLWCRPLACGSIRMLFPAQVCGCRSSKIYSEAVEDGDLLKNFRKDFILEKGASSAINPNQYM